MVELHNTNFVALTSGVYSPSIVAFANVDSSPTLTQAQYSRVGSVITVSGRFTADPTLTATTTSFDFSLPITTTIGTQQDVAGTAFCGNIVSMGAEITGVVSSVAARAFWKSSDVTSQTWSYTFTYEVI